MADNKTSEQKTSPWLLALLLATVLLTIYMSQQPEEEADEIVLNRPVRNVVENNQTKNKPTKIRNRNQVGLITVPDDLIQLDALERKQRLQSVGNTFVSRSWYVPPPPPPMIDEELEPEAPKAPPVPFEYIGRFDEYQLYLQEGDKLYTVEVGDTIKGIWRIESDEASRIEFTYIPLNEQKILNKN